MGEVKRYKAEADRLYSTDSAVGTTEVVLYADHAAALAAKDAEIERVRRETLEEVLEQLHPSLQSPLPTVPALYWATLKYIRAALTALMEDDHAFVPCTCEDCFGDAEGLCAECHKSKDMHAALTAPAAAPGQAQEGREQ